MTEKLQDLNHQDLQPYKSFPDLEIVAQAANLLVYIQQHVYDMELPDFDTQEHLLRSAADLLKLDSELCMYRAGLDQLWRNGGLIGKDKLEKQSDYDHRGNV